MYNTLMSSIKIVLDTGINFRLLFSDKYVKMTSCRFGIVGIIGMVGMIGMIGR